MYLHNKIFASLLYLYTVLQLLYQPMHLVFLHFAFSPFFIYFSIYFHFQLQLFSRCSVHSPTNIIIITWFVYRNENK